MEGATVLVVSVLLAALVTWIDQDYPRPTRGTVAKGYRLRSKRLEPSIDVGDPCDGTTRPEWAEWDGGFAPEADRPSNLNSDSPSNWMMDEDGAAANPPVGRINLPTGLLMMSDVFDMGGNPTGFSMPLEDQIGDTFSSGLSECLRDNCSSGLDSGLVDSHFTSFALDDGCNASGDIDDPWAGSSGLDSWD